MPRRSLKGEAGQPIPPACKTPHPTRSARCHFSHCWCAS